MGSISKLISFLNKDTQITHTNLINLFTKNGMFRIKMYQHNNQEYLVIISQNFFELKAPIFYIHTDEHECDSLEVFCGCSYPISVALKMIHKEGGFILYSSRDIGAMDALLHEINAAKLVPKQKTTVGTNFRSAFKGYRGEYLTIDFILKDLGLSSLQLVSDNPNIIYIIEQQGIKIANQIATISFEYGDDQQYPVNETIEAAKAITFEYGNGYQ